MTSVIVIPARESDLIRDGQLLQLAGKPLLSYTIAAALESKRAGRVVVYTDGPAVAELAKSLGAEVPFLRDPALSAPGVGLTAVLQRLLQDLEREGALPDVVVCLEPSHPIRPAGLVDSVLAALEGSDLDTIFAAYEDHHSFWTIGPDGDFTPVSAHPDAPRDQRPPLFREVAGLVCATRTAILQSGQRIGRRVGVVPVRDWIGLIDTQDPVGLALVERLMTALPPGSTSHQVTT